MQKKLLCFILVLFMIFGYSTQTLPNKVYAEVGESFYSVEKIANEDSSNVQIQLNVDEDIVVNQVVYPDESITVEDLTQYTYSVDQNNTYAFTISYTDSETQEVKEEKVTVEVTEIVEPQVDDQEASGSETTVQQQPTASETTTQQQPTVEKTTPTQKADVTSKAADKDSLDVVYVSKNGNDETGAGTQESPVATLAKAVLVAKDGATIYVMSDLTMTKCARFYNKNLTITSDNEKTYTVMRGETFDMQSDARSWYNPAMIEVGSNKEDGYASLTLKNIVLDDNHRKEGEYFIQADSEYDGQTPFGNEDIPHGKIVQDAIVATYDGKGSITLGEGAVLKNFGGMSAIRMSGGTLNMQPGSKIIDDSVIDRTKGTIIEGADESLYGPAGAIWVQGGTINVESGAYIGGADANTMMRGRAIYLDSGTVNMNGTIQYVKGDSDCWMGENGIGIHIRNSGIANIGGTVTDITASSSDVGRAVYATVGKLIISESGIVQNCNVMNAVYVSGAKDNLSTKIYGTISTNTLNGPNGYAVVIENTDATLFSTGKIKENNSNIATVYAPAGANIKLYGKIYDNFGGQCGGIFMYGNYTAHRDITVDMYNGAEITGNRNNDDGDKNRGGAICSGGSTHGSKTIFTMQGGLISNNTASSGAVLIRKNGTAVMTGGTICENSSYGVQVDGSNSGMPNPSFKMSGGSITNNGSSGVYAIMNEGTVLDITDNAIVEGNEGTGQISISGGDATNKAERAMIDAGVLSGERTVKAAGYDLELENGYADIGLGQANTAAKRKITDYFNSNIEYSGWTVIGDGLWLKPSKTSVNFQMKKTSSVKKFRIICCVCSFR